MSESICQTMSDWVAFLISAEVPVLRKSVEDIEKMKENIDNITVRDLSRVVLDDPMMTLRAMSLLQQHRRKTTVASEVTTFGRVMMMIGLRPFFDHFQSQSLHTIEDLLGDDANALDNVLRVIDQSRYASQYAFEIAHRRYDIDRYEVQIAASLHSTAEIMLWCFAPDKMRQIRALSLKYRNMRSARIQEYVMGFSFNALQTAMAQAWKLPELLVSLMDQQQADNPRVRTVTIATNLARHSMDGLDNLALPSDYLEVATLLGEEMEDVLFFLSDVRERICSVRRDNEEALTVGDRRQLSAKYLERFEASFSKEELEGNPADNLFHPSAPEMPTAKSP